jgi:hypothetical protein
MILDFIEGHLDGDSWENLCDSCYRMRYQDEHYQKVQAILGGDSGIEGFTRTGVVYQCYCPERDYKDEELYNHLRDKMTKDIGKLVKVDYAKRLKSLGINEIKEWHFVIPQYKDPRIIQHAETKRKDVLLLKNSNPHQYDYIHDDFAVIVKVAEDFRIELTRIIRTNLSDVKLNLAIHHDGNVDWSKCTSEKTENIKRKVKAVMNIASEDDEDYKEVVSIYTEAYIKGIEILKNLRISYTEVYEDIFLLEQAYKREVSIKTRTNTNSSINSQLFYEIMDDFENKLKVEFSKYLSLSSIMELKLDLISGWLADCSMQFRSR